MSQKEDYYDILGISKSTNSADIRKAYLKAAKKYHPDCNPGDKNAEEKYKKINEAYEVLKDEQKRSAYDRFGHSAFNQGTGHPGAGAGGFSAGFGNADVNDIFGDIFSDFMGGGGGGSRTKKRSSQQIRGSDLKYNLSITLEDAFHGIDKEIEFTTEVQCKPCNGKGTKNTSFSACSTCGGSGTIRMQKGFFAIEQTCGTCHGAGEIIKNPCTNCRGTGRNPKTKKLIVNIPKGVEDGTRIRITGEGEAGMRGGSTGDLYIFVAVKHHNKYMVDGSNLHCKLPITITKAALGGEIEIDIIDNSEKILLKIPVGTETGDQIRLKSKGMPKIRSNERGDLYIHTYVKTPKKLTKIQRELLQALDNELIDNSEEVSNDSSFFSRMKNMWS